MGETEALGHHLPNHRERLSPTSAFLSFFFFSFCVLQGVNIGGNISVWFLLSWKFFGVIITIFLCFMCLIQL